MIIILRITPPDTLRLINQPTKPTTSNSRSPLIPAFWTLKRTLGWRSYTGKAYEGDGSPASDAGLDLPNALAFVPGTTGGKMAIADFGHSAVRVITPELSCL